MPGRHIPKVHIRNVDKFVHFSLYLIFALLTYFGWHRQDVFTGLHKKIALKVILTLALYGYTVEVLQETLTTDRHYDILDALANTAGAAVGVLAIHRIMDRQIPKVS